MPYRRAPKTTGLHTISREANGARVRKLDVLELDGIINEIVAKEVQVAESLGWGRGYSDAMDEPVSVHVAYRTNKVLGQLVNASIRMAELRGEADIR